MSEAREQLDGGGTSRPDARAEAATFLSTCVQMEVDAAQRERLSEVVQALRVLWHPSSVVAWRLLGALVGEG